MRNSGMCERGTHNNSGQQLFLQPAMRSNSSQPRNKPIGMQTLNDGWNSRRMKPPPLLRPKQSEFLLPFPRQLRLLSVKC